MYYYYKDIEAYYTEAEADWLCDMIANSMYESDDIFGSFYRSVMNAPWYECDDDEKQIAIDNYSDWCKFEAEDMVSEAKKIGFCDRHGIYLEIVENITD